MFEIFGLLNFIHSGVWIFEVKKKKEKKVKSDINNPIPHFFMVKTSLKQNANGHKIVTDIISHEVLWNEWNPKPYNLNKYPITALVVFAFKTTASPSPIDCMYRILIISHTRD